jgi:D-alanyl-D-alanine carboxypeptidase (penicillin-binding protein 5/6)
VAAPADGDSASLLQAVVLAEPSATPTEVTIPSPTPKPSSKLSQLVPPASAPAPVLLRNTLVPYVDAAAVVIMDEASGAVLWENNSEAPLAPASLTKIATAVIALQSGGLDRVFTSDVDSKAMTGQSVMGLVPGDQFTLHDLLYGLMLPSGNDAALVIARGIAGSDAAFVAKMNLLATALGLMETRFVNPHGLSASGHETSAYDLAVLTRYAMSVPGFAELAGAYSWTARGSRTIGMYNANAFVSRYSGGDGVKVGYTRRAGHTLVASATRSGHRVYAVLLNAPNSQADAAKLLDWAFANYTWPAE